MMIVTCEHCGVRYDVPKAKTERFRLTILFFAKCPVCQELRCPRSSEFPYPRCGDCNIPIKVGTLCHAHYMKWWRLVVKSRNHTDLA